MTGPEFAAAHGNDSTDWSAADFEAEMNLADIDMQPVYLFLKQSPTAHTTPQPAPAA